MVLAQTEELDVLHHYHGVILDLIQRTVNDPMHVHLIAAREQPERLTHSFRRPAQPVTPGILS
jgi:hypothetical protein